MNNRKYFWNIYCDAKNKANQGGVRKWKTRVSAAGNPAPSLPLCILKTRLLPSPEKKPVPGIPAIGLTVIHITHYAQLKK